MKKSSKQGFTLIELLAVIVILAIIALITVPLILNVIETAKRGAFKDTAYGLIESAELYYSKEQLKGNNLTSKTFTFPNAKELGYKGENPKSGNLVINKRGQVALAISNDKYCITKNFTATEVTVSEDLSECELDIDTSGANQPDLLQNMVAVKYNGTNWVYADSSDSWYNYDKKQWANAVVLNTGVTKNVGDTISKDEVALWYVWIPRYKYQLFNANNEAVPEQVINIEFESKTETTGTVTCTDIDFPANPESEVSEICENAENGNWYTHPAFTFGSQELSGFWVSKFESIRGSTIEEIHNDVQKISTEYKLDADSHIIKNMEWGAIAYFKQSKYGLGLEDIENFNGNILQNRQYRNSLNCSTTGTIYGVFEMGGDNQIVMGNVCNIEGDFTPAKSGLSSSTFDKKYYDAYNYSDKNGKLGDATKEVVKEGYTDATFKNWYSDGSYFPSAIEDEDFLGITYPWFVRGGGNKDGTGIFAYINSSEGATGQLQALPTHTVLTRK